MKGLNALSVPTAHRDAQPATELQVRASVPLCLLEKTLQDRFGWQHPTCHSMGKWPEIGV